MSSQRKVSWSEPTHRPLVSWRGIYRWLKFNKGLDPADVEAMPFGKVREILQAKSAPSLDKIAPKAV